ncbi:DNA alkylation repair protein [Cognatishimia maritima]|uniref:DNA alkylation repair protein n=1 Tax=Cognatishimia maritima TaxID=870908 RepID=UPI000934A981|nr:DNA alkylation repair protein [Cognatishimia maritima]
MSQGFSLADHLFNQDSISELAAEYAAALPDFDAPGFTHEVLSRFPDLALLERLEWIVDCLESRLSDDFPTMADQLEAAMVPELDPKQTDDDFGRFIHAPPGYLAVRHGLEHHRDRALDLIYETTKRFSMEWPIRPFLNRWPEETLARLKLWATDENYHVRRLVSEGTRPKLPWAKKLTMEPTTPLPLLYMLHADPTRYVTRSVANHLNDIAKTHPDLVVETLARWKTLGQQEAKELDWMTRHALRTLIKQGHEGAMDLLGFKADAPVSLKRLTLGDTTVAAGQALTFDVELEATKRSPVIIDYLIHFQKAGGKLSPKVFKLKQAVLKPNTPQVFAKKHVLKANATTFKLHPGAHKLVIQVNGRHLGEADFQVTL